MTTKEINAIKNQIKKLKEEKNNCFHFEKQLTEETKTIGFHEAEKTGCLIYKSVRVDDIAKQQEIQQEINTLYAIIKPYEDMKSNKAKYKRYIKEIAKLEEELAYKRKWLEENEEFA